MTIRLLDPPLHEFLPGLPDLSAQVERARIEETDDLEELERLLARTERISEENPMLGTRGCRLGMRYPEIYEMQVHAILRAAKAMDEPPHPEVMMTLVDYEQELEIMRELVVRIGDEEGLHAGRGLHSRDHDRASPRVFCGKSDPICNKTRTGKLDHGPDGVVLPFVQPFLVADPDHQRAHDLELLLVVDERDHDLRVRRLVHRLRRAHDRVDLHLVDLRVEDPEPAAARAEHRVLLGDPLA